MPDIHYSQLDESLWPLMNKFYRSHQSSMKAVREAQLWVARRGEIVAALCLRQVSGGHWLTGLFVDPGCRETGNCRAVDRGGGCSGRRAGVAVLPSGFARVL